MTQQQLIPAEHGGILDTNDRFEHAQRVAKMLASSELVPAQFRGKIADCVIAQELSNRIGASVLAVMQSLVLIHGNPTWKATFVVGAINSCGRFDPLRYEMTGDPASDAYGCRCVTKDHRGQDITGPWVTIKMAKAEGWYSRNGSKWQTMPEVMLRYRAATFFGRMYAPELLLGMRTEDEFIDIGDSEINHHQPQRSAISQIRKPILAQEPEQPHEQPQETAEASQQQPAPQIETGLDKETGEQWWYSKASEEYWNAETHSSPPSLNAVGAFRRKRGRKPAQQEQPPKQGDTEEITL